MEKFSQVSRSISVWLGTPIAFITAILIVVVWALLGPVFKYSDSWQLVINTGTTIITFLMVFLIQNTQNRDTKSLHLKLDELILSNTKSRNELLSLENCTDDELEKLEKEFKKIKRKELRKIKKSV